MVLTQLQTLANSLNSTVQRFHTTMVLTQHIKFGNCGGFGNRFPYHYGSYATKVIQGDSVCYNSFHTTMVLTQRESKDRSSRSWIQFPYHYGSYATERSKR